MTPRVGPLKLKAQVFCGDEPAIGPGKADLLEAIEREGSISGAGRALGMSYRRTWLLVDSMNRCWVERLVDTTPGGGRDKGARVTECGKQVLTAYRALVTQMMAQVLEAGPEKVGPQYFDRMKKIADEGGTPLGIAASLCVFLGSSASDGITGKLIAAQWDRWEDWPKHLDELNTSDVYTLRRITGRDRKKDWGDR